MAMNTSANTENTLFVNAYGDRIQIAIIAIDATTQGSATGTNGETNGGTNGETNGSTNGVLLNESTQPVSRNMTATFLPMVKSTLDDAGVTLQQITHILAIVGPGSYTGLRIALASMLGISDALGIPISGISTNDAFALSSQHNRLSVAVGERFGYVVRSYHFADADAIADASIATSDVIADADATADADVIADASIATADVTATAYTLVSRDDLPQLYAANGCDALIIDENPASTPRAKRNAVPASPDATASPVGEVGTISPLAIVSHPALSHLLVAPTPFYSITNPYEPPQQKSV